ncbi:hypothetical protein CBNV_gp026 [Clanis bilineata nucleopolyhedrovirus]|uniref:Uncharacterized protein n=1 Tax=Clanis bilineata nucleopolyhedrovirus TaxID=1307957 RepID=Q0N473_9ABAC|nr:hypothetical protein CBNV_gp026 [Clanis bilineata nucleopolyhedrovirus]ABF47370.1 hypothetical protein [Clanis bilineata nucleopolyhedrovirus]
MILLMFNDFIYSSLLCCLKHARLLIIVSEDKWYTTKIRYRVECLDEQILLIYSDNLNNFYEKANN